MMSRTGSSVGFHARCGRPGGAITQDPGPASTATPSTSNAARPSSTSQRSSMPGCAWRSLRTPGFDHDTSIRSNSSDSTTKSTRSPVRPFSTTPTVSHQHRLPPDRGHGDGLPCPLFHRSIERSSADRRCRFHCRFHVAAHSETTDSDVSEPSGSDVSTRAATAPSTVPGPRAPSEPVVGTSAACDQVAGARVLRHLGRLGPADLLAPVPDAATKGHALSSRLSLTAPEPPGPGRLSQGRRRSRLSR
jgi:hypothetical protein